MRSEQHARNVRPLFRVMLSIAFSAMTALSAASACAGQATLSWSAPAAYSDGTPVTALGGYKVYAGTAPGAYSQTIDVGNVTSYTLTGLNNGATYYFAVTAYDASGNVSGFSNQTSKTFPALYTITASAGPGGNINPPATTLNSGESATCYITPSSGYQIAGVSVDNVSVGLVSSYTFSNVAMNHTISATFTAEALVKMINNIQGTFPQLKDSYAAVADGTAATVLVQAVDFSENLTLDKNINFTLDGGYDAGFSVATGISTLSGTITVAHGSLAVENLMII